MLSFLNSQLKQLVSFRQISDRHGTAVHHARENRRTPLVVIACQPALFGTRCPNGALRRSLLFDGIVEELDVVTDRVDPAHDTPFPRILCWVPAPRGRPNQHYAERNRTRLQLEAEPGALE
jgi:hypothetical protein